MEVLVGRDRELEQTSTLLSTIGAGSSAALELSGPLGIGISRLARCTASLAAELGIAVVWASCEHTDVRRPLAPIEDALSDAGLGLAVAPVERPIIDAGPHSASTYTSIERALDRLDTLTAQRPTLLVLDDAHLADDATVRFVGELRSRMSHHPLGLLACTPVSPSRARAQGPGLAGIASLSMPALDGDEADRLLAHVVGVVPDDRARRRSAWAAGRPLHLIALARCATSLTAASEEPAISLNDIIPFHLAQQPEDARRAGLAVALLGVDADLATLSVVLGEHPSQPIDAALAELVSEGIVTPEPSGRSWRVAHALYRAGLIAAASASERAAMHGAAAVALTERGSDPLRIAEHELAAARLDRDELQVAIRSSARSVAPHQPLAALALLDQVGEGGEDDATVLTRALALGSLGRVAEVEALTRAYVLECPGGAAEVALRRELAFSLFAQNRPFEAMREMDALLALLDADAGRARALAESSFAAAVAVDLVEARRRASSALADPRADEGTASIAHAVLSLLDHFALRMDDALRHADSAVALAQRPDGRDARRYQPWFCAALAHLQADHLERAAQLVTEGRLVADTTGAVWAESGYDALQAFLSYRAGRLDEAEAAALAVLPSVGESDGLRVGAWAHAFAGLAALHREGFDDAAAHASEARALVDAGEVTLGHDQTVLLEAVLLSRGESASRARESLWEMWAALDAIGLSAPQATLGVALARACIATNDTARAGVVADWYHAVESCGVPGISLGAAHVALLVEPTRKRAARVLGAAEACPRRIERADALVDAARVLAAAGDPQGAERVRADAASLYVACGSSLGTESLGLGPRVASRPRFSWDALTPAERAVLDVLAEGASNAEIATRLHISKRTVEVHVSAAYRKLAITSRVALARVVLAHH